MLIGILGPLTATADDGTPVVVAGPRPRALLVLLALNAGRSVSVDAIVDGQYGEDPPSGAAAAVQTHVSRLRKSVEVEFDGVGYRLPVDPDDVDALRFERLAAAGRTLLRAGAADKAAAVLREALGLWRGPALADLPHAAAQAVRLEELRLTALEDLADADPAGTSVADLTALVAEHPLRERLRGRLMRALHAEGRRADALAEFEDTRRLLADELGADPSPELADTHLAILRADRPTRTRPPAQLTSFVGREAELARLVRLRDTRLVTVVGPGGTGKTRLAIEAARDRDACFVDLSPVTDGDLVPHALLGALGLRESGFRPAANEDPVSRLVAALDEPVLLVLDNCEQVLAPVAALVRTLLAGCPGLAVLATSREPLGLTGETLLPLAPLDTGAVRLFADRAAAVRPGFAVTPENHDTVAALCDALDRLPLAIELAAARLRQFPLDELADRLAAHGPFRLLSRGDRTAAARHRTLRDVVAWSWDLLSAAERTAAARFSVFPGSATLAAAETVCDTTDDVLADLVDRSLLETDGCRYRMLDTIRLFCAEQLTDATESAATRRRHADYFLALALRADPHLRRAEQLERLAELSADHANLMAALRWSVGAAPATAFRLVAALTAYWWLSGRRSEAGAAAAALLAGEVPPGLDEEYVSCVVHAVPRADDAHWQRALTIMRERRAPLRYPFVAALWGMTAGPWGDPAEAEPLFGDDPWSRALGRLSLGLLGVLDGRPADGEAALTAVLATFRGLGERWGTAQALDWLAEVASWRGEWARAQALWAESLALYERFGALEECVDVLCRRAACRLRQGDPAAAAADYRRAGELSARAGQPDAPAVLLGLGDLTGDAELLTRALAASTDDFVGSTVRSRALTALGRHTEALALARRSPLVSELADAVEGVAGTRPPARAAYLLGTAVALRGMAIAGDPAVAATAAAATASLGAAAFAEEYSRGARQTRAEAIGAVGAVSADSSVSGLSVS